MYQNSKLYNSPKHMQKQRFHLSYNEFEHGEYWIWHLCWKCIL